MMLIFKLHLLLAAFAIASGVLTMVSPLPARAAPMIPAHTAGVAAACDGSDCLSPGQLITAAQAREMKRALRGRALLVDIRGPRDTPRKPWSDAHVPFMQPTPAALVNAGSPDTHVEFRIDFTSNVDDALRNAHLRHDDPLILVSPSGWSGVLAALLVREHGYSNVYVVCE
jgi:rhodanese-related sulfurtransferase